MTKKADCAAGYINQKLAVKLAVLLIDARFVRTMIATEKIATKTYVLVLNQGTNDLQRLGSLLTQLKCPVEWADSPEQAMRKAKQTPPCLVILAGNPYDWSHGIVHRFRSISDRSSMTIVGLTDFHAPSWLRQEENPGVDGFLVNPLNQDVLNSLVQSAWVRQSYGVSSSRP